MIDTDKYEGHTPAPWQRRGMLFHPEYEDAIIPYIEGDAGRLHGDVFLLSAKEMIPNVSGDEVLANITLMADAPLLLAEVKRLREGILEFADYLEDKVTPYMTKDMHEVVPIGGMVSDLHEMIKGVD